MSRAGARPVVVTALGVSVALAAAKLLIALESSTSALLASTVHALIDVSCLSLLILGLQESSTPTGRSPQLAREAGGAHYFWSFVVAIPLYSMGGGIAFYEGAERLARPQPLVAAAPALLMLAVAAAGYALVAVMALRQLQPLRPSPVLLRFSGDRPDLAPAFAVLVIAAAATTGDLVAFGGLLTAVQGGELRSDPGAAIGVGLVMSATAAWMAIETKRLLPAWAAGSPTDTPAPGPNPPETAPVASAADDWRLLETKSIQASPGGAGGDVPEPGRPAPKPAIKARQPGRKGGGKRRR